MSNRSAGFVLYEALMALILAAALLVGVAQLLCIASQQRRAAGQFAAAAAEAGNLLENILARPWTETTADRLGSVELSDSCRHLLPGAEATVDVADEEDGIRRIRVRITWQNTLDKDRRSKPVQLVGWMFRDEEAGP